jgi:hypothetical protein
LKEFRLPGTCQTWVTLSGWSSRINICGKLTWEFWYSAN